MMSNTPDYILLQQYFEGQLNPEEMHRLEKQALEDPFLSEAMEGYSFSEGAHHDFSLLQKQLHDRIAQQQQTKQVYSISWQRLSIAAVAGLMFISAGILFWMNGNQNNRQLANQTEKRVDVNLNPQPEVRPVESMPGANDFPEIKDKSLIPLDEKAIAKINRKAKDQKAVNAAVKQAIIEEKENILSKDVKAPTNELNEVVVQAYGTQRKTETGSVASISVGKLTDSNINENALQGKVSGLSISKNNVFKGKVTGKDGEALPGAVVKAKEKSATVTDINGDFQLPLNANETLEIGYIGYETKKIIAKPGRNETIILEEGGSDLNEVLTIGYGAVKKGDIQPISAEPVGGYEKYNEYLKSATTQHTNPGNIKGVVTISFTVEIDGNLSGFKIVKGLTDSLNEEAIRIINDGPKWKPAANGKPQKVKVGIKF